MVGDFEKYGDYERAASGDMTVEDAFEQGYAVALAVAAITSMSPSGRRTRCIFAAVRDSVTQNMEN